MFNQAQQQQTPFAQPFQQNNQQQFGMNPQQPFGQRTLPFGQNQTGAFGQNQNGFVQQQNQGFNSQSLQQQVQQQAQNDTEEKKRIAEKASVEQLMKICEQAFQLQGQNDFRELLTLLSAFHVNATKQIDIACNESDALKRQLQSHQNATSMSKIISRCREVKERNDYLLKRSLNIRRRLMEQTYLNKSVAPCIEKQYELLNEKIKHLKMKVSNKYTQLRFNQINRVDPNPQDEPTFGSLKLPLVQLKKVVEHLKKSSALQMQDLTLLIKHIHGETL